MSEGEGEATPELDVQVPAGDARDSDRESLNEPEEDAEPPGGEESGDEPEEDAEESGDEDEKVNTRAPARGFSFQLVEYKRKEREVCRESSLTPPNDSVDGDKVIFIQNICTRAPESSARPPSCVC